MQLINSKILVTKPHSGIIVLMLSYLLPIRWQCHTVVSDHNMKENKSPGVDGLSPKILKETVEQISKPLAHVFNMSLQEGIVPLEWKEANIIPLFKKGSRNKSVNYRPVSLTSVICKLPLSIQCGLHYCNTVYCNYKTRPIKNELPASRAGHGVLPLVSLDNTEDVTDQS